MSSLPRDYANNLCHKFGTGNGIAGNFEFKEDFDAYYDALFANKRYLDKCWIADNGRILTWLPYKVKDKKLLHEITATQLLNSQIDKYYVEWYWGPQKDGRCGAAYFGLVPKYKNIHDHDCSKKVAKIKKEFHQFSV